MKKMISMAIAAMALPVLALTVVKVESSMYTLTSGPDYYADGTRVLEGEKYIALCATEEAWSIDSTGTLTGATKIAEGTADANGCCTMNINVTDAAPKGDYILVFCDTRTSPTTLGDTVYTIYPAKKATVTAAKGAPKAAENADVAAKNTGAGSATATGTVDETKVTFNVAGATAANVESSTDLKTWTKEGTVRVFADQPATVEITKEAGVPTKFYRVK